MLSIAITLTFATDLDSVPLQYLETHLLCFQAWHEVFDLIVATVGTALQTRQTCISVTGL